MSERVVIVGSSIGGIRTAQELRHLGFDGDITVVGEESELPYDKPPLSKQLLVGSQTEADIALLGSQGWAAIAATGRLGVRATGLDIDEMLVRLDDGDEIEYDILVIATGVRPRTLRGAIADHDAIYTVRELRDARALVARAAKGPVVVVGAGFIGAEIASSFRSLGVKVSMTEALDVPFARVLGPEVGAYLATLHRDHAVNLLTGAAVTAIEPTSDGAVVRLVDGRTLEAATVVIGVGTVPNTEWLEGSGIQLDDGVLVDAGCAVMAAEGVYAVGDVARRIDPGTGVYHRVEHWTNATEQAHIVARQIVEPLAVQRRAKAPYFWSDQFGIKIQMVGRPENADAVRLHRYDVDGVERAVALYERRGQLAAAVTFGWPRAIAACRHACGSGASVEHTERTLAELASRHNAAPAA